MAKSGQIIVKTADSADTVFFLLIVFLVSSNSCELLQAGLSTGPNQPSMP